MKSKISILLLALLSFNTFSQWQIRPSGHTDIIYAVSFADNNYGMATGEAGRILGVVSSGEDITERRRAEAALVQTNEMLSRAEQLGHIGSWELDIIANRVVWSDGLYRIFGLTSQAFGATYEAYLDCVHPDDRERVRQAVEATYREHRALEYECRIVRPDGRVRVLDMRAEVVLDDRGESARLLGLGIDITERKERERELEAIATVSAALRAANTRAEMLPILLAQVMGLLKAGAAAVALLDPATGELVVELGQGEMAAMAGQRLPAGAGIGGHVIATSQPYVTDDAGSDPNFYQLNWMREAQATACVPLITRQQAFGVLWAGRVVPFAGEEVRVLSAIGDIAGNAIQRAVLHEQTGRRAEHLAALHTIDAAISSSLDLRLTLNILLDQVMTQLGVDAAAVLLFKSHLQTLEYAAGRGFRGKGIEHLRLRLGEGYAGRAALERRTIGLPNLAEEEPDFSRGSSLDGEAFQAYYGVPLIVKGQVEGVLEIFHRTRLTPDPEWLEFLEALAGQAAIAIDSAQLFDDLQHSNLQLTLAYDATIEGWSRALDLRDKETEGHTLRVTEMTLQLARGMGTFTEEELVHVRRGALLHDIGKMGIPDGILLKPGPLTDEEWVIMRKHPAYAYELLSPVLYLRPALEIPYCHHEKWDGTGYPRGLRGEQIPPAARMFAVVDVWDALRSDRPYRGGWPEAKVREHIQSLTGTHFDPQAVEVFLRAPGEAL